MANNCLVNNRSVITTCGPTSNAFTQNTTVIICDEPQVPAISEAVQNAEGNASNGEPVVKQEVHPIEEMLQKYIDVGEWKNDFIFTDTECRQILGELARTHFGMWELKESRTNPGEFYFFNKKNGTCQWNEPDAWVDEIKKRVSIEKVLRIEQDDENNQLEDEILGEGDIIEQPVEENNFVVEDPIQHREENVVQSLVDDLITERENDLIKQPQSAVVLEEEGKKSVCEGTEGVEETLEETLEEAVETALDIPVETPLSPPPASPVAAAEEPLLNIQPTICSVTTIEKPIEEENNKIVEENVAENPPIHQQEGQQIVMNNGGDESTNFDRPFNTTDSFMAAAMGGGINDDTMDIANFIEQFDEQLNSPPPNNRENVQQVLSNEIVIEKVSAEEVNNKNNNIPPPRPIKYTNQTAKKTINGGGGLSFCQFSVTGRKRVNDALKFKPKEEAKPPQQQQLLSLSSPRKRPPIFKHVALQRVRVSLPDVEKLFKEPEMDCGQLKKAILELEQKILASNKKEQQEHKFTPPSTSSFTQQQHHHQSTSTCSTSFKAKITIKRRPVAKRYGKNIDQICSTSTERGNRRSSSSSSNNGGGGLKKRGMKKKNVVKKAKKNDSSFASDTSFFHSYGGRRSSTPFLGKDVQLFICIHCPAGSHLKYTNENDYRLHVLARHRIVTNDCEAIHDYIKKQRFIYIGNLNF
uniref:WW domain-containing protein n=1 Tax=Meloidogyne javanica TaxID=6303 RepID=A0A915N915_MELJA